MKITQLTAENFKRLSAVQIDFGDSGMVVVGGQNGAGKSSVLDAIEAALGGQKHVPPEPIRRGEKKARIVLKTDRYTITRKFTAKSSTLEITATEGARIASPQKLLDEVLGDLTFDPLDFSRMEKRKQAETLRLLVGLDFAAEDAKRKEAYDQRTDVGRELRRLQGAIEKIPEVPDDTPDTEASVVALSEELERRRRINAENAKKRSELEEMRFTALAVKEKISALEAELDDLEKRGRALRSEVDVLEDVDVDEVKENIANAEETNRNVRTAAERRRLEVALDTCTDESERLTQYIAQIDETKANAAANARYPIDGLSITDDGVRLDGLPWLQSSQAQQLRASIAIGLALNPELKLLLIRDGSLLDKNSLIIVKKMADDAGAQVVIERVGDGKEVGVLIEDGTVSETR